MRKFFELAVVSRKSVKGKTLFTAEAKSKAEESLGSASVVLQKEGKKGGIYFRYVPTEEADAKESIHVIELKAEDQAMVTEVLKQLKEQIIEKATEDSETGVERFLVSSMVSAYINEEEGRLRVPEEFGLTITNEMISKYWNIIMGDDEWIGIEVKFEEKISEEIDKLVEEKRREQQAAEEALKQLAALFQKGSVYDGTAFNSGEEDEQEEEECEGEGEIDKQLEELSKGLDQLLKSFRLE